MKIHRHITAIVAVVGLAACDKPSPKPTPTPEPSPTPQATPTPVPTPAFDSTKAEQGKELFSLIQAQYPKAKLDTWGTASPDVKACLWIPTQKWQSLMPFEQAQLVEFLASQVPVIRANPDKYVGISPSAPIYSRLRGNVARMRDRSIIIFTMIEKDGQWIQEATVVEE